MNASVSHHATQALFVASDTAVNRFCITVLNLVGPLRIRNQLAAHCGAVDSSALKLFFHKIRVSQSTHSTDREIGQRLDLIAEL